ncbi:sigma-70 family RNA polymerase sigma factor [Catenovulum sp. 2E275]|uniref:sigma-70 family RNA polymerase sigma factor n=1 Tax=Catenovulum sp. 2E275 TaxID=2980497 RepID=UPI0021D00C7D|nr:sigma-70 family RNA polymerase sigma factor [Catenovulum sp. 2E275]MCU4674282.1 sigma-70 family RNA polymerase sigma factor [Catenovulum sp. 2E275]
MDIVSQDSLHGRQNLNHVRAEMSKSETANWALLLQKIAQDQDRKAFTLLFNHFAPRLKSFGISVLKQESLAMEMVQETMLNVWTKAHLFNPNKGAASTWIYTIARNIRYDILRKISQKKEDNLADELWPVLVEDNDFTNGFTELENLLLQGQLQRFYQYIPAAQLEVILLIYLDDKSHQEVSDLLGIPLGTVKSRVRLGLAKLQQAMEEQVA